MRKSKAIYPHIEPFQPAPLPDSTGEIVRMSVANDMRQKGIGSAILSSLCARAATLGLRRILLETTETWDEVVAFYERFGFRQTHRQAGDIYFALDLEDVYDPLHVKQMTKK